MRIPTYLNQIVGMIIPPKVKLLSGHLIFEIYLKFSTTIFLLNLQLTIKHVIISNNGSCLLSDTPPSVPRNKSILLIPSQTMRERKDQPEV